VLTAAVTEEQWCVAGGEWHLTGLSSFIVGSAELVPRRSYFWCSALNGLAVPSGVVGEGGALGLIRCRHALRPWFSTLAVMTSVVGCFSNKSKADKREVSGLGFPCPPSPRHLPEPSPAAGRMLLPGLEQA